MVPKVSIIVPSPEGTRPQSIAAVEAYGWDVEILHASGNQPSAQRNEAARQAKGEILYFLDDDSVPDQENLKTLLNHFQDPNIAVLGGPSLCPQNATDTQKLVHLTMCSRITFGPSRARYQAIGSVRCTNEKEVILCNLAVRRDVFWEAGGFDQRLYPNEENAFLDAVQRSNRHIIYDPEFSVERPPRDTYLRYCRMLFNYGRGRGQQIRVAPTVNSVINLAPAFFVLLLLSSPFWRPLSHLPLIGYLFIISSASGLAALRAPTGVPKEPATLALYIASAHILYGTGLLVGLLNPPKSSPNQPQIHIRQVRGWA